MTHLTDDEMMRYSRQILLEDWDLEAQIRLKNSHAIIVGMGGLGCPVAQVLVRAGIGSVDIIDHDVVDVSNLQRQILYTTSDVGRSKALAAKDALQKQNEWVNITAITDKITQANAAQFIQTADLVIDCTDNFLIRDVLNRTCHHHKIALLSTSAIAQTGQIALYTTATACYQCVFGEEAGDEMSCATSGVLASTVSVIGALASQAALSFLGKDVNPIANKLLIWQGERFHLKKLTICRDAHCPVCGS